MEEAGEQLLEPGEGSGLREDRTAVRDLFTTDHYHTHLLMPSCHCW